MAKDKRKTFIIGSLGMVTSWLIAVWKELVERAEISTNSLVVIAVLFFVIFYILLYLYYRV